MKTVALLVLVLAAKSFGKPFVKEASCGYESCRQVNSSTLNVHIVPHSHDDVGWLKTVTQYYYGSQTSIQRAGVQYIITSVLQALQDNPERKFIQVETAFFHKWWQNQNEETRDAYRQLVNNGQIEIIGGAWSMNDEAASHYHSTVDQFTLGLGFINETLGECGRSKVGWQIDPFGHSREMASTFAQLGYDALFFARLDWRDKEARLETQTPEMIWRGSANLGNSSDLFTSVLYNFYGAPSGFCFDILCSDDPIVDDEESPEFNLETKVNAFANFVSTQSVYYQTSNVIITMGGDFNYQDAHAYFINLDRLIKGFERYPKEYEGKPINVFYSTPSCYAKAVNDEANARQLTFPVKIDDFFPYASDPNAYWTGYFSSRATSKRFERQGNNLLQVAKQLSTFAGNDIENLESLREAVGIMQHHDAITGTEKQHVANDYHRIVDKAVSEATEVSSDLITDLLLLEAAGGGVDLGLRSCLLSNVSYCPEATADNFIVTVYNPLSRNVSNYVTLPVPSADFTITDPDGENVEYQLSIPPKDFSYTELEVQPFNLIFYANDIPPLGLKVYYITNNGGSVTVEEDTSDEKYTLGDETIGVSINPDNGKLQSVTINGNSLDVTQDLFYYVGTSGNNSGYENRASGAYIFRPNGTAFTISDSVETKTFKGALFDEIHQIFEESAIQVIRVYKNLPYIEFDWIVGPYEVTADEAHEVVSRFSTNIASDDVFFTDSNGRELLRRTRNNRVTYTYTNEEPITGNYYPVTSRIVIKDDENELAVLNDRAQGGSSLASGEIELMVFRNCRNDDDFGVGESLYEKQYDQGIVVRGQHFLTFGSVSGDGKTVAAVSRNIAQQKILAPWVFVANATDRTVLERQIKFEFAGLNTALPENVQILTLEPLKEDTILLRLEHVLEVDEDPTLSEAVTVDLKDLFNGFQVTKLVETTLGANQLLEDNKKLQWNLGDYLGNPDEARKYEKQRKSFRAEDDLENLLVGITPMQIRTFIASIEYTD